MTYLYGYYWCLPMLTLSSAQAIAERIKQLDFHDCKVRVLNVDSQASFDNILVSVIGEISNRSEPSRKFVQTFVLAEQPGGYYVLNDIFRYLSDEDEEFIVDEAAPAEATAAQPEAPVEAPAQAPAQAEPAEPAVQAQVDSQAAAAQVDEKLEQAATAEKAQEPAPKANGTAAQQEKPATPAAAPAAPVPAVPAEPDALKPEKPNSPEPTPAKAATPAPEKENVQPAKPAAPKTWANIASNRAGSAQAPVPTPVIPVAPPKPAPSTTTPQPQPSPAPAAPATAAPAPATPAPENAPSQPSSNDGSGWQTAGHDHNKRQSRAGEDQNVLAYIKNVNEKVDAALLKQTLSRYGKIKYFDVSRQKVCLLPTQLRNVNWN